jgi:hypothetical protein
MFITFLVHALALQMELEPGKSMECLEEMAILCREQLSSDLLDPDLDIVVESFSEALLAHMFDSLAPPSQQIIECLCEANARLPDSWLISSTLHNSFYIRFIITQSNEDCQRLYLKPPLLLMPAWLEFRLRSI